MRWWRRQTWPQPPYVPVMPLHTREDDFWRYLAGERPRDVPYPGPRPFMAECWRRFEHRANHPAPFPEAS